MEKKRSERIEKIQEKRLKATIVVLAIFFLFSVFGGGWHAAHLNKVVREKQAKIEKLERQAFDAQTRVEELLGELKDLKEPIFKIILGWGRTRKVELSASNFHKYYVGLKMAPLFRLHEKILELHKTYNEVYYPGY